MPVEASDGHARVLGPGVLGDVPHRLLHEAVELLSVGQTTEHAAAWLHVARLALESSDVACAVSPLVGDPRERLAEASQKLDLLVCGTRGCGRPPASLLGSVSTHLITHAQRPVLVVPPTVARSDGGPLGITSAAANA